MIYILLPVHNRRKITEKFIDCLIGQTYQKYHLVLIDDGSSDDTDKTIRSKLNKLTIIKGTGNWWWAGCLQQGINWLKKNALDEKNIIAFMNDDIAFDTQFLQKAIDLLGNQDILLHPQSINQETGKIEETGVYANFKQLSFRPADSSENINCLPTRCLFMNMSVLCRVGDLYPRFLPHYLSDYEFTIRAHNLGFSLITSPKLLITSHGELNSFENHKVLTLTKFLRLYFSIKHPANPIYFTRFILLASPKLLIPLNVFKVWLICTIKILRQLISA